MIKSVNFILGTIICFWFLAVSAASAQAQVEKQEDPTLVKPGIIASTGSYTGRADIATSKGSEAEDANSVSPVTASISREQGDRCKVTFKNNGDSAYSLSGYVLVKRGSTENRRFFSVSVPAGQSQIRTISGCYSNADSVAVNLTKATKR